MGDKLSPLLVLSLVRHGGRPMLIMFMVCIVILGCVREWLHYITLHLPSLSAQALGRSGD
jgi:hypothetical protein